jgi:phosphatidylglycerophosphate synthase
MRHEQDIALCIIGEDQTRIWYESTSNRLKRAFAKVGVTTVIAEDQLSEAAGAVILVRSDAVLDAPVVAALPNESAILLLDSENAQPIAAHAGPGGAALARTRLKGEGVNEESAGDLKTITTAELGGSYWHALRKREKPYALKVTAQKTRQIEWRMFMGTYKGATDLVTKWFWPLPAFYVTRFCARLGISPNMVTWLSFVMVVLAFWFFLEGYFGWGLAAGWFMTFLDTVDGKLARTTLTSSKLGNVFDHGIDLVHPPFWYVAWGIGLQKGALALDANLLYWSLGVILAGYVLQRVLEGISIWLFKLEIHVWRPIDTYFRQITARRNPNMLLLTAFVLAGRPDWGLLSVAIWTAVCFVLHLLQLLQAWVARRQGPLSSWLSEAAPK